MSHRIQNLLGLASGLTQITSRSTDTKEEMIRQLTQRMTTLVRAHELVRPFRTVRVARPCSVICLPCFWRREICSVFSTTWGSMVCRYFIEVYDHLRLACRSTYGCYSWFLKTKR